MESPASPPKNLNLNALRNLPRNLWATSLTSFFMDISSEMVLNILPLYLFNVLGVTTGVIGIIEGLAESIASLLKVASGWISDRIESRKWLAVSGYALSALSKPFFLLASNWQALAVARWIDRAGKGIRTAPRDALVAESVQAPQRGLAFGFHRAADTAGAMLGLLFAFGIVCYAQSNALLLSKNTFQSVVLISLIPALMAVLILAIGAREVRSAGLPLHPRISLRTLGKPFVVFMLIIGLFELGNSSDAFLVLRAQDVGISVTGILAMLVIFNLVYAFVSTPAGAMSDRIGRKRLVITGWLIYSMVYLGFGFAGQIWHIWLLYACYGLYYGLSYGVCKALIADLVTVNLRGTAYGAYSAVVGLLDFPASLIAGLLWQGAGTWVGLGASAPFIFGALMALLASLFMALWMPRADDPGGLSAISG